ncbi:MAG: PAS domain S-box protein [Alphaproteobacteria bacterium]|nr:PAS domain S-box protein [Alphaproteobacteria bacterium]
MRAVLALLAFLLAPLGAAALGPDEGGMRFLGRVLDYLDAPGDSPDIAWAKDPAHAGAWRKGERDVLSFGVWREAVWLRFEARGGEARDYLLLRNARTETARLYIPDGAGGYRIATAGMKRTEGDFAQRFRYPLFALDLPEGETSTLYLRVENRGALRLDLRVANAEALRDLETVEHLVLGLMFGVLIAVAIYALLSWRWLGERASLLLSLFVLSLGLYFAYQSGIGPYLLGPFWAQPFGLFFAVMAVVAGSLFGDSFLALARWTPALHRLVFAFAAGAALFIPLFFLETRWALAGLPPYVTLVALLHLFIGWRRWRAGGETGRDWLIGWATILMAVASHTLLDMRLLPLNAFTSNLVYFGAVAGALIFAAALSRENRRRRDEIEKALRESGERFALASRGAYDGLFDIDFVAGRAYYAPRLHELFGLDDGVMGEGIDGIRDRVHSDDVHVFDASVIRALRARRRRFEIEFRVRRPDGEIRWMMARALFVHGADGRIARQVGSVRDITEARRTEARLGDAVASIADGFALFGPDDHVVACNESFARLYGHAASELQGKSFEELLTIAVARRIGTGVMPPDLAAWMDARRAAHRAADGTPVETLMQDGRIYRVSERRTSDGGSVLLRTDVTELVGAIAEARAGEDRVRMILDSIPARVAVVDRSRCFRYVNRQYCEAIGLAAEAILGRPVEDAIGAEAWAGLKGLGDRALVGETVQSEGWVPYARLGERYVLRVYTPSRAADGAIDGYYVFATDLTAQKRAEQQRLDAEALRRAFIETAVDCVIAMDDQGRVIEFNPAAVKTFGIARERAIGAELAVLIVPERLRAAHRAGLARHLRTGISKVVGKTIEVPALRADGSEFPAELTLSVGRFGGRPYYSAYLRDVTERNRAEQALADSESRYALALKGSNDGIYDWDLAKGTAYVSPRFLEILGLDPARAGQVELGVWDDRVLPEDLPIIRDRTKELLSGSKETIAFEFRVRRPDGEIRWIYAHAAAERDKKGRVVRICSSLGDETERKDLERQLLQSQKMEALGQLAGGIAHDFNNVLSVISGYATLARRLALPSSEVAAHLGRILEGVTRAAGMTREMLAFGRRAAFRAHVFDLRRLLRDQTGMLAPLLGAQVNLAIAAEGPPIAVKADPNMFAQAIMNLAINARDAMPEGGPLAISVSDPEDGRVRVVVADGGIGMDEATQRRIFEPFFTTKAPGAGTGLGLAMVYGIVTQSGGRISVESRPGEGSRFIIDLPISTEPIVEDAAPKNVAATATAGRGRTILLAEDETQLRELLVKTLGDAGYRVLAAENGVAALEILDALEEETDPQRRRLDLLLTDLVMPELGGIKLARLAQELRPDLRVLYMTGYPSRGGFLSTDIPEGATVLDKPIDIDRLVGEIAKTLERGESPP